MSYLNKHFNRMGLNIDFNKEQVRYGETGEVDKDTPSNQWLMTWCLRVSAIFAAVTISMLPDGERVRGRRCYTRLHGYNRVSVITRLT